MSLELDTAIAAVGVLVAIGSLIFVLVQLRRSLSVRKPIDTALPGRDDGARPRELSQTEVRTFQLGPPGSIKCQIGVITGDIKRVKLATIWVNGENTDMEMARFTENSISAIIRYHGARHDAAGRVSEDLIANELASVVGTERPVASGSAFVTSSGELRSANNVRHIIHVAAVQGEPGAGFRQVRNIGQCVTNALVEADRIAEKESEPTSILFPLLGTGMGGAQVAPTVQTLLGAAINYLDVTPNTALRAIYFLAYADVELDSFMDIVSTMPRLTPTNAPSPPNIPSENT